MAQTNSIQVVGRLVRDVELKPIKDTQMARLTLAVTAEVRTKEGFKEEVCFINATVWGDKAVKAANLHKGEEVFIAGRLKQEKWIDKKDGTEKTAIVIHVDTCIHHHTLSTQPLFEENEDAQAYRSPANTPPKDVFNKPAGKTYKSAPVQASEDNDDLPF